MDWQLADALNKLKKVIAHALDRRPPYGKRRGQAVVMLAEADYPHLTGEQQTLKDHLLITPDLSELDLTRDQSPMREVTW